MEFKPVTKDTDLSSVKITFFNWDVELFGEKYTVCRIEGFYHGQGGKFGENDLYAYPSDQEPSPENLIAYWAKEPVCWGIKAEPRNTMKTKWGNSSLESTMHVTVTRNGVNFYTVYCNDLNYGIAKAQVFISEVQEDVVEVNNRYFDKDLIGRKIRYDGKPAVIESYFWGQHAVWIVADNPEKKFHFEEYEKDEFGYWEEYQSGMKVECLSPKIDWFPQ